MAESQADKTAQFITSPLIGGVFTAVLAPARCDDLLTPLSSCALGHKENLFGSTLDGFVGTIDTAGIFFLGILVAVLAWLLIDAFTKKST